MLSKHSKRPKHPKRIKIEQIKLFIWQQRKHDSPEKRKVQSSKPIQIGRKRATSTFPEKTANEIRRSQRQQTE